MNPYYIYALKDPRINPARAFYIGKGTGNRAWEHLLNPDSTRKGKRIEEIRNAGHEIVVTILADELSEHAALKLESELIAAFGTETTGGLLTNTVVPSGTKISPAPKVIVPAGAVETAQLGLTLLKNAVFELARANASGITNSEACKALGLQSNYAGGSKDYLSWSILGLLMREGKISRVERKRHKAVIK